MDRFLTPEAIRLVLSGLGAGAGAGVAWRLVGRSRLGAAPFLLAVLAAARYVDRSDWVHWDWVIAIGVVVTFLSGVGAARLLASYSPDWRWVAAGALVSAGGVWAGVPENGPALLVGG